MRAGVSTRGFGCQAPPPRAPVWVELRRRSDVVVVEGVMRDGGEFRFGVLTEENRRSGITTDVGVDKRGDRGLTGGCDGVRSMSRREGALALPEFARGVSFPGVEMVCARLRGRSMVERDGDGGKPTSSLEPGNGGGDFVFFSRDEEERLRSARFKPIDLDKPAQEPRV